MPHLVILVLAIIGWLVIGPVACSDETTAKRVLAQSGYTDVRTTGYRYFGCSQDDGMHTGFEALGPGGTKVSGVVCSGIFFKGYTIRLD